MAYEEVYEEEVAPPVTMTVTYAEIRDWAVWLQLFTASDLADAMGVNIEWGRRGVKALLWHGICEDTGDVIDGPFGPEPIIGYVPLPPGPKHHPHGILPEVIAVSQMGGFEIFNQRGVPVRIRTERQMRKSLSTPGARQTHKNRERAYELQEEARRRRAEEQRIASAREKELGPKWKRKRAAKASKTAAQQANAATLKGLNLEKLRKQAARNRGAKEES